MVTNCIKGPCKAEPGHVHALDILNHQISCFPGSVINVLKSSCWGRAGGDTCPGADPVRRNPAISAFSVTLHKSLIMVLMHPALPPGIGNFVLRSSLKTHKHWGNAGNMIEITTLSGAACTLWETRDGLECIGVPWPRDGGKYIQQNATRKWGCWPGVSSKL